MTRKTGINMALFDLKQKEQIIGGFQDKLSVSQIKLVANPLLDPKQMWQVRYGFINHLSMEEVATYAETMELKRLSLIRAKEEVSAEEMVNTWVR